MLKNISELTPHPLNLAIYGDSCDSDMIDSIMTKGVLVPIMVTDDNRIISGHRRFAAAKACGLSEVPVFVSPLTDEDDIEEILIHSNKARDRSSEQKAREFNHLQEIEARRAKKRMESGKKIDPKANLPQGQSRDLAAQQIGMKAKTAEKAGQVVKVMDALEQGGNFDKAQELRETLNSKSIDAAYKEAKPIIQQNPEIVKPTQTKVSTFNATNDNIEWAKWTWNPVTGCLHGCTYCYANEIAMRFTGHFKPEFHAGRMDAPDNTRVPEGRKSEPGIQNVFVCSMADLFGEWVPQEWIDTVIEKCRKSPQWNFLFLTKNPKRYIGIDWPQNAWVGTTIDTQARVAAATEAFDKLATSHNGPSVLFVSMEPMLEKIDIAGMTHLDWLIVGSQSRTSKNIEFQPEWEWVAQVTCHAINSGIKVYWKPNLTVRPKEYPSH